MRRPERAGGGGARAAVGPIRRNAVARCDEWSEHERHRPEPAQGRRLIASALQADLYFADPYAAWQRGSNETANGLTRKSLADTDFSTITEERLRWVEQRLCERRRKRLGFRTPLDVF